MSLEQYQPIFQNFKESKVIIINSLKVPLEEGRDSCFIFICFQQTILSIDQASLHFLHELFSFNPEISICFTDDHMKNVFDQSISVRYNEVEYINYEFQILNFIGVIFPSILLHHKRKDKTIRLVLNHTLRSISEYLIIQAHLKSRENNKNRLKNFIKNKTNNYLIQGKIEKDEFIRVQIIDYGSYHRIELGYHIEKGELVAIKIPLMDYYEVQKLFHREVSNYLQLNHPFIPNFIGKIDKDRCILIEYINGRTLCEIRYSQFKYKDRITIIFKLMLIIDYLHQNRFIYRNLNPGNIIIGDNNTVALVDLDRAVEYDYCLNNEYFTNDFCSIFVAPEVNLGQFTYSSDIYSLGVMIYYMMKGELPHKSTIDRFDEYPGLYQLFKKCTNLSPGERPSITELITEFYFLFNTEIENGFIQLYNQAIKTSVDFNRINTIYREMIEKHQIPNPFENDYNYKLGFLYYKNEPCNFEKAIYHLTLSAKLNNPKSLLLLGLIYNDHRNNQRDIKVSTRYFEAAAQNNELEAFFNLGVINEKSIEIEAQTNLGTIYHEGQCIERDINKAIHYYSLAANQNEPKAQTNLGIIYYEGKYIEQDINKAIHYLTLAANQNEPKAQTLLGDIYLEGKYIERDINKAIHYYSLAAQLNHQQAQFNLGMIYLNQNEVKKAINFLYYSANNGNCQAQYELGIIFYKNNFITRDINQAIYYFSQAANQNHLKSQLILGYIYYSGQFIQQNIDIAISYFLLAARNNNAEAQFNLGVIYSNAKYGKQDIDKAIYYYELAIQQNHQQAMFNLGLIYLNQNRVNEAIQILHKCAMKNDCLAQYTLGIIYYEDRVIKRDITKAINYFIWAANQNHVKSQLILGYIYYSGEFIQKKIYKAIEFFEKAANLNDPEAQFNLGLIYLEGREVNKNLDLARKNFQLAANQNHQQAKYQLYLMQNLH